MRMLVTKVALAVLTVGCFAGSGTVARQASAQGQAFEAASIRPRDKDATGMVGVEVYRNGRVWLRGFTLKGLVAGAFHLPMWQIEFPAALDEGQYDIVARAPELPEGQGYDTRHGYWNMDDPRLNAMLRALLVERFQLKYSWKKELGTVYVLERSTKPLMLKAVSGGRPGGGEVSSRVGIGWSLFDASMQDLADHLSRYTFRRPVVDKTGLLGGFDFQSRNVVTEEDYKSGVETVEGMLPGAVTEMGLTLRKTTGEVETLVVSGVGVPVEN